MSGVGGPLAVALESLTVDDLLIDESSLAIDAERVAIARRIGRIAAACQREAVEGTVPLSIVEMRLVTLSDDVRAGIHGAETATGVGRAGGAL
jgi:hypothetical protein